MNFPLRTAFAVSHMFWVVVSSFSFVSRKFLISFLILFLTHSLFIACYSVSMILSVLVIFLWCWFLVSVPCGQRKCLIWFQFSWISWGLLCVLSCGQSLKMSHVHLKRMCILRLWNEKLYIGWGRHGADRPGGGRFACASEPSVLLEERSQGGVTATAVAATAASTAKSERCAAAMSYCRQEGKDRIIFVTKEDHETPSSAELVADDPNDL